MTTEATTSTATILLCPGQGVQMLGMARGWVEQSPEAAAVLDGAESILGDRLGAPLRSIMWDGPVERLNQTDVSQPAIYACSIASYRGLLATGASDRVVATAGLSLGEYTALHLAGAFDFATGLELVAERGRLMQEAADASGGGMVALVGADEAQAESICDSARADGVLVCANFNAPGQIVLSGDLAACGRAVEAADEAGIRAKELPVAGAFHSPLMQPAADRMRSVLDAATVQNPNIEVWSNVTAGPHGDDVELLKQRLVEQIVSPVRWAQTCAALPSPAQGDEAATLEWHELAPGKVLSGLMRRIDRSKKVITHDQP